MKNIKIVFLIMILFAGVKVFAATPTLYLEATSATLAPGSTVNVNLTIDSTDPVNALDLGIIYPNDKLEYLGSDNTDSIVTIWQEKPQEVGGAIEFSGGMIRPFSGKSGQILTLQFKLKEIGSSKLSFSKTKIYLANGQGTEISAQSKSITIKAEEEAKVESEQPVNFENTPENVEIEEGLAEFKAEKTKEVILPIIIGLLFIGIVGFLVYNKRKRKI